MSDNNRRERRTGGAGSLTNPLSDADYRRQMRKIEQAAAADSEPVETSDEEMRQLRERFGSDDDE